MLYIGTLIGLLRLPGGECTGWISPGHASRQACVGAIIRVAPEKDQVPTGRIDRAQWPALTRRA